jgi:iron-sulfur cluster assembly accessory protein
MELIVTLHAGEALLEALLKSGVAIAHDCEGKLACATCRVIVRDGMQNLEAPSEDESDMLERASAASPGARLACQAVGKGRVSVDLPQPEAPPLEPALSVTVTPQAARHLLSYLQRKPGSAAIRLAVEPSGCSGFRYRVLPADTPPDGDSVFDAGDLQIIVDSRSRPFVQGTTIDLSEEGLGAGLLERVQLALEKRGRHEMPSPFGDAPAKQGRIAFEIHQAHVAAVADDNIAIGAFERPSDRRP